MPRMQLTLLDSRQDFAKVEEIWQSACARTSHSYFLSWGWIENWIRMVPVTIPLKLAIISKDSIPAMLFFVGQTTLVRHYLVRSHSLFLTATGRTPFDHLFIEYNAMLCPDTRGCSLADILALLPFSWDEFVMPGLDANAFPGNRLHEATRLGRLIIENELPARYVDLHKVRQNAGDYLALLSKSSRAMIKRSYRGYQSRGELRLEVAQEIDTALEIFDDLVNLHRETWQQRGRQSAFLADFVLDFHRELIRKRMAQGEIQLLRLWAGDTRIGCLYNFVFQGKVLFYQSGVCYESDARLKPGYTCHSEAIRHNALQGHTSYDFLGGDENYKLQLSTDTQLLIWAKIQKPKLIFELETRLKTLKQALSPRLATNHND